MNKVRYGIEFEYAIRELGGKLLDFETLDFKALQGHLDTGMIGSDDKSITHGDLGIKRGYWYLEGDERFDETGTFVDCKVKGIEVRTPQYTLATEVVNSVVHLQNQLNEHIKKLGLELSIIGYNPITRNYRFSPPLNSWEVALRARSPEYGFAQVSNLSYGPDINISFDGWSEDDVLEATKKLTFYSPFMVPFSFSSPFYDNKVWRGYSKRTYERTWRRASARCFVNATAFTGQMPEMIYRPRIPSENGRIEFKAFDAVTNTELLLALTLLVKGICLDQSLKGRSVVPSKSLHQRAALKAFEDPDIFAGAREVVEAVRAQLSSVERKQIQILEEMLQYKTTPSHKMIQDYKEGRDFLQPVLEKL